MQAAGIGGAGGKAGFATFRHQHVHALTRQIKRGGKPDHTTTNHQHITLPRDLWRGGSAGFPGDGRGAFDNGRFAPFRHLKPEQGCRDGLDGRTRRGEIRFLCGNTSHPRQSRATHAPLATPHARTRFLLDGRQRSGAAFYRIADFCRTHFLTPAEDGVIADPRRIKGRCGIDAP